MRLITVITVQQLRVAPFPFLSQNHNIHKVFTRLRSNQGCRGKHHVSAFTGELVHWVENDTVQSQISVARSVVPTSNDPSIVVRVV